MSNENQPTKELVVDFEVEGQKIHLTQKIVQEYIVGTDATITNQEFRFFTELCKARKLNPFLREVFLIKFDKNTPAQLVVAKDAIQKRAVLNPNYDGKESGIIVQKEDGTIEERQGTCKLNNEILVGGWARVYRKDWKYPTYCSVGFEEVAQRKSDGSLNKNWKGKSATMVEKVAKVRALRETFVEDLAGMYEEEEFSANIPTQNENAIENQTEVIEQNEGVKEVSLSELS